MLLTDLPQSSQEFSAWPWEKIEPYFQVLIEFDLQPENAADWLAGWSKLAALLYESQERLYVATTVDTTDEQAESRYRSFLEEIFPHAQAADQKLKEKLLASAIQPHGFELPLRNLQAEAEIFNAENLPLRAEELLLISEYDKTVGAQTVEWDGEEITVMQLQPVYEQSDRARREQAWRLAAARQLQDRPALNELWRRFFELRRRLAAGAGLPDFRAYKWKEYHRFDYTPADCRRFHQAIERVVVPAAGRLYERRRRQLGVANLRPWDLAVDPLNRPALQPFEDTARLVSGVGAIFYQVDPTLGDYFELMRRGGMLDLDNRKGKAPGGYCTEFAAVRKPFIFMNAVGIHDDIQTLLHEGGHAFHCLETAALPYHHQRYTGNEFSEVASMCMELLAAPYLGSVQAGFYTPAQAAQARAQHLENALLFWPYMAVVDAFQHWAYEHPEQASDPAACDAAWGALWERFMPGVDWSGLEDERVTGWQRKLHIFDAPFYYVEYGMALLGAFQVWRNARRDQVAAVQAYRRALAQGGTATLPDLFATAGARFAFDDEILAEVVELIMGTLDSLQEG